MRPFQYQRASDSATATRLAETGDVRFLAGGTTLLDLMKLDVMRPTDVVDINDLEAEHGRIQASPDGLTLGALARMSAVSEHPEVRKDYPVIAQSLASAASTQLRHMATLGGNVLQRTRCNYFRDPHAAACNKRMPGSGCAALDGVNRKHAILGVSSHCIAAYPGDFAQALVALDATVDILGRDGGKTIRFEDLHRPPGGTPDIETALGPGELITGFFVPAEAWSRRSLFLKIRDRESYDFALASAAVALNMAGGVVREARIGLGGVATIPWRARDGEAFLAGRLLTEDVALEAADIVFRQAETRPGNAFKADLGKRTLVRALLNAAELEV